MSASSEHPENHGPQPPGPHCRIRGVFLPEREAGTWLRGLCVAPSEPALHFGRQCGGFRQSWTSGLCHAPGTGSAGCSPAEPKVCPHTGLRSVWAAASFAAATAWKQLGCPSQVVGARWWVALHKGVASGTAKKRTVEP